MALHGGGHLELKKMHKGDFWGLFGIRLGRCPGIIPEKISFLQFLAPAVTVGETEGAMDSTSVFFFFFFFFFASSFGGEGCHLRVVPPGQLLRRPSTPKRCINIVLFSRYYIWSILHYFSIYIKSVWR